MFPVIQLGPLALQAPGLIILLGFWLALEVAARQSPHRDALYSAGFYGALAGLVGGRIGYAALHWQVYRTNLLGLLALNPQTLEPAAGLIVGACTAAVLLSRYRIAARPLLDALAPALALFAAALSLANFASGAAFGASSTVPWAIELWGAHRHPIQLYEFTAALAIMVLLWWPGRNPPAPGLRFLLLAVLYGLSRLLLEPLRAESTVLFGQFRGGQVFGLALTLTGFALMPLWLAAGHPEKDGPPAG